MKTPNENKPKAKHAVKTRSSGRGQKPMIWLSGVVLVGLAMLNEHRVVGKHGPLWPVFVAILTFLYLWWLSSLLFDLLFVWHRYIQGDAAHKFLRRNVRRANLSAEADPPPDQPIGGVPAVIPPNKPRGGASFTFEEETEKAGSQESMGA